MMKAYAENKIKTVSATGFDDRGVKTNDFSEFKEIKDNGKTIKTSTFNKFNKTVIYTRFDDKGRIASISDSSNAAISTITYTYNDAGHITTIQNNIKDSANDFSQTETHQWLYNATGKPEKMWRIINNGISNDSLELRFVTDDEGNTAEEKTFRRGVETSTLFYYYDDNHRLTDIVRYNTKYKRLIPDAMFEYDDKNNVIQKITTTSSLNIRYFIWRYIFDNRGLKTKEALFNSNKDMTGKIEFSYTAMQ
jgi:antitoxin component YwqK of YwqJK toxin-antitoxin module